MSDLRTAAERLVFVFKHDSSLAEQHEAIAAVESALDADQPKAETKKTKAGVSE